MLSPLRQKAARNKGWLPQLSDMTQMSVIKNNLLSGVEVNQII